MLQVHRRERERRKRKRTRAKAQARRRNRKQARNHHLSESASLQRNRKPHASASLTERRAANAALPHPPTAGPGPLANYSRTTSEPLVTSTCHPYTPPLARRNSIRSKPKVVVILVQRVPLLAPCVALAGCAGSFVNSLLCGETACVPRVLLRGSPPLVPPVGRRGCLPLPVRGCAVK